MMSWEQREEALKTLASGGNKDDAAFAADCTIEDIDEEITDDDIFWEAQELKKAGWM